MFQIGEEDFSFGEEDFWSEALEVEAATSGSNFSSGAPTRSLVAENRIQQNQTGSCSTKKALQPRCQGLPMQMPGQHQAGVGNISNNVGDARMLQGSNKDLPTTPGNQPKRKFSFKQKSPRDNPAAPTIDAGLGANKRAKFDDQRPTPSNITHLQVSGDKPQSVTTGNIPPPVDQFSGSPKLRQPLSISNSTTERQDEQTNQVNSKTIFHKSNLLDKTGTVTGRDLTTVAQANANFRHPGHKSDGATSKAANEHPFEFGDNFDEEMEVSDNYFNWDPVIEPSSSANATKPKSTFTASNQPNHTIQEKRLSFSDRNYNPANPNSVPSPAPGPMSRYSNPDPIQSGTSNTWVNSNQLRPISMQGGSLRSVGPPNNSSSGAPQSVQLNNSTDSATRFSSSITTQNPCTNFPPTRTQGNPQTFQPRTPSLSFSTPRPGTQYPLRTNAPMRAGTPGYTVPSPRFQGRGVSQVIASTPHTSNIRTPNANSLTPRSTPPAQCFQNFASTNRSSTTQGDRPFSTHGAKPQSRGTPTPQTPLLTSKVAQLFQTPPSSGSGPARTRVRKFPGPAGVLPKLVQGQNLNDVKLPSPENDPDKPSTSSSELNEFASSQGVSDTDFSHGAWQTMKTDLGLDKGEPHSILAKNNIALVLRKASLKQLTKNKVPLLCVMVKAVAFDADASVVLRDPTGEMQGTVHRRVVEEHQSELKPGSVLVLRQVGVLSPSIRNHYLNITPSNLIQIYPSEATGLSQSSQKTPKSRSRHLSTSKGRLSEAEQNTPRRSRTSETKSRRSSGGVKNSTLVEASPDDSVFSRKRSSRGSRLVEEGKHVDVSQRASSSSDLRQKEKTTLANRNNIISSRLESEAAHSSTSHETSERNALAANSCVIAAADARNTTESFSNVKKSEDFTDLLADIGDDFFDEF